MNPGMGVGDFAKPSAVEQEEFCHIQAEVSRWEREFGPVTGWSRDQIDCFKARVEAGSRIIINRIEPAATEQDILESIRNIARGG